MKTKALQALATDFATNIAKVVTPPRRPKKKAVPLPPPKPKGFKITSAMIAQARKRPARDKIDPFVVPQHPAALMKLIPREASLAMDEAIQDSFAWAATQMFGSYWYDGLMFLGFPMLAEMAQRPEYRVISETIASDMTRKWITFEAAGEEDKTDKIKEITEEFERLKVQDRFREAAEQDGFFGRSHLYLDTGDTEDRDELLVSIGDGRNALSTAKIGKNKPLLALRNVEAVWTYPMGYNSNDPLSANWYKPDGWFVMGKQTHRSRLLTFVGREVPDILKPAYSFGGLSMSQMAKPYVENWIRTRQSVSDLIHAFSVMALGTQLEAALMPGADEMYSRADLFNMTRDNRGLFIYNKDSEDIKNIAVPLGTLDKLQAQSQEQMASVSRIPLIKLLGISPSGLNATAEPELLTYEDMILAYSKKLFTDPLSSILGFVQLSLFGEVDPAIKVKFEPLREMTEKEQSEIDKAHAETDQIRIDGGVIDVLEARKRLAADETAPYHGLDVEDIPEPPEPEMPDEGAFGEGGGEPPPGGGAPGGGKDGGGRDDAVLPFAGAADEFKEGDHPREKGGEPGGMMHVHMEELPKDD